MINTLRHNEVFNANNYMDKHIVVVGLGAIGSKVLEHLVCAGLTNITACDFDKVEDHNLANQLFDRSHIGMHKTTACWHWVEAKCGIDTANKITFHTAKLDHNSGELLKDADVIISCVDTFDARGMLMGLAKEVWAGLFIEAGMATGHATMFMVDPSNPSSVREWMTTLGDDDDPSYEVSACGTGLSVGVTASLISGIMSWSLMNYLKTGYTEKKLRLDTAPFMISKVDQR